MLHAKLPEFPFQPNRVGSVPTKASKKKCSNSYLNPIKLTLKLSYYKSTPDTPTHLHHQSQSTEEDDKEVIVLSQVL